MNKELKRIPAAERIRIVADLYNSGMSLAEVSAETGITEKTARQYLNFANIPVDDKKWIENGEAAQLWARAWNRERRKWL